MNRTRQISLIAVAFAAVMGFALPAPLAAQPQLFEVPAGCTAFLTVQARGCTVSHHWQCAADPQGTHWRVSVDGDGPFHLSYTDAEFRWLQSWNLRSGGGSILIEPEQDSASLTELLDSGSDSMVFSLLIEGASGTVQRDYTGFDSLTGDAVSIDGERLLVTDFAYQYTLGAGQRRVQGNQFVHPEWRLFFGGIENVNDGDESFEYDSSPMEFAETGEAGFLSMTPIYDCGEMMSGGPVGPMQNG